MIEPILILSGTVLGILLMLAYNAFHGKRQNKVIKKQIAEKYVPKEQLTTSKSEILSLSSQLTKQRGQSALLESTLAEAQIYCSSLDEAIQTNEDELLILNQQLAEQQKSIQKLIQSYRDLKKRSSNLQKTFDSLEGTVLESEENTAE